MEQRTAVEGGVLLMQVGRFWFARGSLPAAKVQRLQEIHSFFDDGIVERLLEPVATQTFLVSLRLLDYTMTNWAKKTRVMTVMDTRDGPVPVNIFSLYKDWLHFYRRRGFDSFRRRERVFFKWQERVLETTVAQLNFLRWAEIYGVLQYVIRNKEAIEQDMVQTLGKSKKRLREGRLSPEERAQDPAGSRRTELSRAPQAKCVVYPIRQQIRFGEEGEADSDEEPSQLACPLDGEG